MSTTNVSKIIRKKREDELDTFVNSRGKSHVYKSLSGVTSHISSEYSGRTIIELIQNGYDPHPSNRKNGEIGILLDETEGEYGCLYVANRGDGFKHTDFDSLCNISGSKKVVNQGIGNKGLGFRSVLTVCRLPQIFSRIGSKPPTDHFNGFCFTFPTDDQLNNMYRGTNREAHLDAIIKEVPRLLIPVEITERPGHVSYFAEHGFATVVRMPLINVEARKSLRKQIKEISDSNNPVQLFLDRLAKITIEVIPAPNDDSLNLENETLLLRRRVVEEWVKEDIEFQSIKIGDGEDFLIVQRVLPDTKFCQVLTEGIESEQLPKDWIEWEEPARIAVAVRRGGLVEDGRFYNFLPMGEDARSPLAGHINAPFLTEMDRRNIRGGIRFNKFLIESAAHLCLDAARLLKRKKDEFVPCAIFDLTMWDGCFEEIIDEAAPQVLGAALAAAEFIPVVSRASGTRWQCLNSIKVWEELENCDFLTPERVANDGNADLVWPALGTVRVKRLCQIAWRLLKRGLDPSDREKSGWIEAVAERLLKRKPNLPVWNKFYRDLALIFGSKAASLSGRKILLTQNYRLAAASRVEATRTQTDQTSRRKRKRTTVFFPPIRRGGGLSNGIIRQEESVEHDELNEKYEEEVTRAIALGNLLKELPTSLKRRIRFLHPELECVEFNDPSGVREFFQNGHLVSEYETRDIQRLLARATADPGAVANPNQLRRDALQFAFELSFKGQRTADLGEMIFFVPTNGGWLPAREAYFDRGWRDTMGGELRELVDAASGVSPELTVVGDAMIPPYRLWPIKPGSADEWREFLFTIGVTDILRPADALSRGKGWTAEGRHLAFELLDRCDVKSEIKEYWGKEIQQLSTQIENPHTAYAPKRPIWCFPGLNEFGDFSRQAKHLYAKQLTCALRVQKQNLLMFVVHRPGHAISNRSYWPSPISTFIKKAAWMPVRSRKSDQTFVPPTDAWHAPKSSQLAQVGFLKIISAEIRSLLDSSEALLEAVQDLIGLNVVNTQKSAGKQIKLLGQLARQKEIHLDEGAIFDELYTEGWNLLLNNTLDLEDVVNASSLDIAAHRGDRIEGFGFEHPPIDLNPEPSDSNENEAQLPTLFIDDGKESLTLDLLKELGHPVFDFRVNNQAKLADLLVAAFPNIAKVSEVETEILADGNPVSLSSGSQNLIGENRKWLLETILLATELKAPFLQGGIAQHNKMRSMLEQLHFRFVNEIECRIRKEISTLPVFAQGCLFYKDKHKPTIFLETEDVELSWTTLKRMAHSISEALGYPVQLSSVLGDVFAKLEIQCGSDQLTRPSDEDYEIAFRTNQATIRASRRGLRHFTQNLVRLATPLFLMLLGKSACDAFRKAGAELENEKELETLLIPCAAQLGLTSAKLIASCREAVEMKDLRRALGLDLKTFNQALIALGPPYEQLNFEAEQQTDFDNFCSAKHQEILESLRNAFVGDFDSEGSLEAYICARRMTNLSPDPDWAIEYEELTDDLLFARLNSWLVVQGAKPISKSKNLDNLSISDVRNKNRQLVRAFASEACRIVIAWCEKNGENLPSLWSEGSGGEHNVGSHADEKGWLDFRLLDQKSIIEWLRKDGFWPKNMPATLDLGSLNISRDALDLAEQKAREARLEKERRDSTIIAGGHELSIDSPDLPERLEQFLGDTTDNEALWTAGVKTVSLENVRAGRPRKRGSTSNQKKSRGRKIRTTKKQLQMIGVLGELLAFEWLKKKYPGLVHDECWVSTNRSLALGVGGGDDDLGYDIKVPKGKVTHYYEVKATRGDEDFFQMGSTQIETAIRMRADKRERFHILFFQEVTDPIHCFPHVLPNPYSITGKNRYRIVSKGGLGLEFQMPKSRR